MTISAERRAEINAWLIHEADHSMALPAWQEHPTPAAEALRLTRLRKIAGAVAEISSEEEDFAEVMEAVGLLAYEQGPRADEPPKGCAETIVNYERPGH